MFDSWVGRCRHGASAETCTVCKIEQMVSSGICPDCKQENNTHASTCSWWNNIPKIQPAKQWVRIVLKDGHSFFDAEKFPDFNLQNFVASIRSCGMLLNDSVYVASESIAAIFIWSEASPPKPGERTVIQFPKGSA